MLLLNNPPILIAFIASVLMLSLLHPFVSERPVARYLVATAAVFWLWLNSMIDAAGLVIVAAIAVCMAACLSRTLPCYARRVLAVISTLLILLLALNTIPAAQASVLVKEFFLGHSHTPYTLSVGYNKVLAALLMLAIWWPAISRKGAYGHMTKALPLALIFAAIIIASACMLGLQWDPKWYWFSALFVFTNLALTCVVEEVFFRGLLQRQFSQYLSRYKFGALAALILASGLFGLAHTGGGLNYALFAAFSGIFYGAIYWRYRSIHAAIICHWLVNVAHFTGFRYPWLP